MPEVTVDATGLSKDHCHTRTTGEMGLDLAHWPKAGAPPKPDCRNCGGRGRVPVKGKDGAILALTCPDCGGTGRA